MPHLHDMACFPEVPALLDPNMETEVTAESFDTLIPLLPRLQDR